MLLPKGSYYLLFPAASFPVKAFTASIDKGGQIFLYFRGVFDALEFGIGCPFCLRDLAFPLLKVLFQGHWYNPDRSTPSKESSPKPGAVSEQWD